MFLEIKNLNPGLPAETPEITKRKELISLLRDPARWPSDFKWNYRFHDSCAIGLASKAGIVEGARSSGADVGHELGLDAFDSARIFLFAGGFSLANLPRMSTVTPEHIAQALEETL